MNEMNSNVSELEKYMQLIAQLPLISPEREIELARLLNDGEQPQKDAAREEFINANLRLVIKIAIEYSHCGLDLADLVSEGNLGLIKAVERFQPEKGAKFSTYAAFWIRQRIRRALSNHARTIRIPVHQLDRLRKVIQARKKLESDGKSGGTEAEIASELGLSTAKVKETLSLVSSEMSLDEPMGSKDDSKQSLQDLLADTGAISPDENMENGEMLGYLRDAIEELPERHKNIILRRFGLNDEEPETLERIGVDYHVSRERIRQLESDALRLLRRKINTIHAQRSQEEIWMDEPLDSVKNLRSGLVAK